MAGTVRMEQQRQSRGETERRNPYPRTGRRMSLGNRGRPDKIVPFHRTGRLIFSMQAPVRDDQVKEIADIMEQVASAPFDEDNLARCREKAQALIARFPLYPVNPMEY